MKKIGIITICDNNNYGNRLQNFALQSYLEKLGCYPKTIINYPYVEKKYGNWKDKIRYIERVIKTTPFFVKNTERKELKLRREKVQSFNLDLDRVKAFEEFNNRIKFFDKAIGYYNAKTVNGDFDYFVTGSDQVWNCTIFRATGIDFLTFADEEKRIAYAASISLDEIPSQYYRRYKHFVKGMRYISVREEKGKQLIEDNFGKKAIRVLDPTMLIRKDEWEEITECANVKLPKKYIACMFLGDKNNKATSLVKEFATQNNLEIVKLNDSSMPEYNKFGPTEFLYTLRNAEYIVTDSFHGCVFSILFQKDFCVTRREGNEDNMYSRLESLLDLFGLKNRELTDRIPASVPAEKWKEIDAVLETERKKAKVFLETALNIS